MVFVPRRGSPGAVNYIEYIQGSGVQYLKTDVTVGSQSGFDVIFSLDNVGGEQGVVGGFIYGGYNNNFCAYNGQWMIQYGNNMGHSFGTADTLQHEIKQNIDSSHGSVLDGSPILSGLTFYDIPDRTFNLFCYDGGVEYPTFWITGMKLYRATFYSDGQIVRDYHPCKDADGIACVYDKITKSYIYNSGNGEFIAGPEI